MSDAAPHPELLAWRRELPILERTTYLVSHSVGAMPRGVHEELAAFARAWEERGVRAWGEGWWEMSVTTGDLLAPILGVRPGSVAMHLNATLAAAVFLSCLDYDGPRRRIVTSELEFPSLLYLLEGERRRGAEVVRVPAAAGGLGLDLDRLLETIDETTRAVVLSHVLFKTAWLLDAAAVARRCREVGALLLLDVYQSAGVVPLELEAWGVDAAVGGSVKWLCGGPGAGYLWVRPDLARELWPALTGWQAAADPFGFDASELHPAAGAWRFLTGTPNVPALHSCRPGFRMVAEAGPERIRERSLALTQRLIDGARELELASPTEPDRRGGTVVVRHPEAEAWSRKLLARNILCDHRPGAGIRLAPHFYSTEEECDRALEALAELAGRRRE